MCPAVGKDRDERKDVHQDLAAPCFQWGGHGNPSLARSCGKRGSAITTVA